MDIVSGSSGMSGRVRKQPDSKAPGLGLGPLRATLPVASLMKQPRPQPPPTSPSPRILSPEHALSGQRSPGAINYKVNQRSGGNVIRRTASLDAIHQRGHWPRDSYYYHGGLLTLDKGTQTEDNSGKWTSSSSASSEDKLDRLLRQHRLHRTTPPGVQPPRHHEHGSQTMSPIIFSAIKSGSSVPLRAARSSVEGLNQEIERLVLCPTPTHGGLDRHRDKATPEGHRAPLAELLRRSVNTQTPAPPDSQSHSAQSSGPPSRESHSSGCSPERLHMPGGSICSSPDLDSNRLGTSPHINKFLAREPPDGCERVNLKFTENVAGGGQSVGDLCPIRPSVNFQLRPSLGSAFQPLQTPASSQNSNRA